MYDIIGDIHGHASALRELLGRLGYRCVDGRWYHPEGRTLVFVGDIIDRGPEIRTAVETVRSLERSGTARVVMGNHEYNALCWHTLDDQGRPLRAHNAVHRQQHAATLAAFQGREDAMQDLLDWIAGLPLFMELDELRVVHAAWDDAAVEELRERPSPCRDRRFLIRSSTAGYRESDIVETLLKGVEAPLPPGAVYHDKEGVPRYRTRTRWWVRPSEARVPLSEIAMPPADRELGERVIAAERLAHLPGYTDHRPVFFGHYWLSGSPAPLADRVACLDYSVARDGHLCAYRWDGVLPLSAAQFTCVPAGVRP